METIKHKGIRIHIGCGGEVVKGRCLKCGNKQERKSLEEKVFGKGPLIISTKEAQEDIRQAHRRRIQDREDIRK